MFTSSSGEERPQSGQEGFTLIELLVGLALTLCILAAALGLWGTIEHTGVETGERTVDLLEGRVAVARLDRDLRLATALDCPFPVCQPLLLATNNELVFLSQPEETEGLRIVAWEFTSSSLMRRWSPCPSAQPLSFSHLRYIDNKTMLEKLASPGCFHYFAGNWEIPAPVDFSALPPVDSVTLELALGSSATGRTPVTITEQFLIGR